MTDVKQQLHAAIVAAVDRLVRARWPEARCLRPQWATTVVNWHRQPQSESVAALYLYDGRVGLWLGDKVRYFDYGDPEMLERMELMFNDQG